MKTTRKAAHTTDVKTRKLGCPCGHLYADECIRHLPLPTPDPQCDGHCRTGLEDIKRESRELGMCACVAVAS